MVKEEDHHAVAQLCQAVGHADRQQTAIDGEIEAEAGKVEGAALAHEVAQIQHHRQQLRSARCHCRAEDAPVQKEDGYIVQHAVGEAARNDRQQRHLGMTVRFHQNFHVVGHHEAEGEGCKTQQVVLHIGQRHLLCAQQQCKGLKKDDDQHRQCHAHHQQQHGILGKEAVGILAFSLAQIDGDDGGSTHGEQQRNGEHGVHEGYGQIDGAHGVFSHASCHEQTIHDGVQGKDHEGGNGGGGETDEIGQQTALRQHFGLKLLSSKQMFPTL